MRRYDAPCGELVVGSFGERLCLCDWVVERHHRCVVDRLKRLLHAEFEESSSPVIEKAMARLDEYFSKKRYDFDLPLLLVGTEFQKRVWNELLKIPYGKTTSYGTMAENLGVPTASRAVANANGANSMSIFIPCHRVIGSNGTLTGYGGGLYAKEFLLKHESTLSESSHIRDCVSSG